ncbi:hypothetical protein OSM86_24345, partial [Escherichia coli]|nr:hypothetical protein [Escherichia coli]
AVKEKGDDIVFLRKIVQGGADKSYVIQVARLSGVPESVLSRAQELVEQLSDADILIPELCFIQFRNVKVAAGNVWNRFRVWH